MKFGRARPMCVNVAGAGGLMPRSPATANENPVAAAGFLPAAGAVCESAAAGAASATAIPTRPHRLIPGNDTDARAAQRRRPAGGVPEGVLRSPHLYRSLRLFCLGAFAHLTLELDRG